VQLAAKIPCAPVHIKKKAVLQQQGSFSYIGVRHFWRQRKNAIISEGVNV
jgi:ABC-type transporter lipoprotein component MlaA